MIGLAEASIHVEAPQRDVFDLFTTADGLCSWMAKEAAIDLRPGGRWRWVHDNDVASSGEYVDIDPYDRVTFTYGWESGPYAEMAPGSTMVEVRFEPSRSGTEVTVTHTGVPDAFRQPHVGGWTYFLGVLAAIARGDETPAVRLPGLPNPPGPSNPPDPSNLPDYSTPSSEQREEQ